jgi:hypothetical protein
MRFTQFTSPGLVMCNALISFEWYIMWSFIVKKVNLQ